MHARARGELYTLPQHLLLHLPAVGQHGLVALGDLPREARVLLGEAPQLPPNLVGVTMAVPAIPLAEVGPRRAPAPRAALGDDVKATRFARGALIQSSSVPRQRSLCPPGEGGERALVHAVLCLVRLRLVRAVARRSR